MGTHRSGRDRCVLPLLATFTVGVMLGLAINLLTLPLLLWRWLLGFGIAGAAVGYLTAATPAVAQQRAVQYALSGLLVGLVLGTLFRMIRRLRRRGAQA